MALKATLETSHLVDVYHVSAQPSRALARTNICTRMLVLSAQSAIDSVVGI